ncbi:MAG: hypothetical protein IPJ65_30385 [Archangiaceae bacterium]|nr:hypothetical protein [Archangiaceae bacterium]
MILTVLLLTLAQDPPSLLVGEGRGEGANAQPDDAGFLSADGGVSDAGSPVTDAGPVAPDAGVTEAAMGPLMPGPAGVERDEPGWLRWAGWVMGSGRITIGLVPIFLPTVYDDVLFVPMDQRSTNATLQARLFGARDAALGALVIAASQSKTWLFRAALLNASVDLSDLTMTAVTALSDRAMQRTALITGSFALGGLLLWSLLAWLTY